MERQITNKTHSKICHHQPNLLADHPLHLEPRNKKKYYHLARIIINPGYKIILLITIQSHINGETII